MLFPTSQESSRQSGGAVLRPRSRPLSGGMALLVAVAASMALTACGQSDSKTYDISPIFPLSADKCVKYDGKTEGAGFGARCWVTKSKCEQAVQDWRQAMREGGVSDAIQFSCN